MNRFSYAKASTWDEAQALLADRRFSLPVLKGGGLDLLDQMKEGILEPDLLIDVRGAREGDADAQEPWSFHSPYGGSLLLPAAMTLATLAEHPGIRGEVPVLAQAAESAATPQVRNVATLAGNLLQRPRCWYFRHDEFHCLKKGGSTCFAVEGENQHHAIFGGGPCHIVHPSNLAIALHVLDGQLMTTGGDRDVSLSSLYHLPDRGIRTEHTLPEKVCITHISCTPSATSAFYAIKHKQSFDWPIVMCAVALTVEANRITAAKVCAGAVAPIPWPLPRIAEALIGVATTDDAAIRRACALAANGATPMSQNAYKVRLLPVAVERAVLRALGRLPEELL